MIAAAFLVAAAGLGLRTLFTSIPNVDATWYLYVAQQLRGGARLYVDVLEVNPPWIIFLSAVPLWVADILNLEAIATFRVLVFIGVVSSCAVSTRLLVRGSHHPRPIALVTAGCLLLVLLYLPGADIGEREHLALVLLLPYCCCRGRRVPELSGVARIGLGLAAGLAISLKPHFVLPWLMVEIAAQRGWGRSGEWFPIERVVAAACLAISTAVVFAVFPEYVSLLREQALLYGRYWHVPASVLVRQEVATGLILLTALLWEVRRVEGEVSVLPLIVLGVGFLAIGILQQKGWLYHLYVGHAVAGLALMLLAVRFSSRDGFVAPFVSIAAVAAAALYVWGTAAFHRWDLRSYHELPAMKAAIETYAPGGTILAMSGRMTHGFPLVTITGTAWASSYPAFWVVSAAYAGEGGGESSVRFRAPVEMRGAEKRFFETTKRDILRADPKLIFVDVESSDLFGGARFEFLAYFAQDPDLAHYLSRFCHMGKTGAVALYVRDGCAKQR